MTTGPASSGGVRARDATSGDPNLEVLDLHPRVLWRAFKRQSPAFWALNVYLFIEYVRPQTVWPVLDVLPWGELALATTVVALVSERTVKRPLGLLDALLIFFCVVLGASLVTAFSLSYGLQGLSTFINWVVVYYLVTRIVTTEVRLFLFMGAFFLWSLKMSQFGARSFVALGFGFRDWGVGGGPGWFQNSGEFAIQMCVFLAMSLHVLLPMRHRWPRWKFLLLLGLLPGTALISVIASSSRGGQLGAAAVLLFSVGQSRHRVRGLIWAAALLPILWFIVPPEQKQRFTQMGDDNSSVTRLTYWKDGIKILNDHPTLGIGYNNWIPYYRRYYNPFGQVPHNIFVEAGSQMGYLGLLAFLLLIVGTFVANARTRRMARLLPGWGPFYRSLAFGLDAALIGFLVPGFFVTVLFYPFFWINLSFTSALFLLVQRRYGSLRAMQRRRRRTVTHPQMTGALRPT